MRPSTSVVLAPLSTRLDFCLCTCLCLVLLFASVRGGKWYNYRMMRNPGLLTDTATDQFDCVAKCESTAGCSAASWSPSTQSCLKSMCNNLDLVKTTGWNTYILLTDFKIESVTAPAPNIEWMLTDTCGNSSQGVINGPKMNLYGVGYSTPPSIYSGRVATFLSVSTNSYGLTDNSSAVNFPLTNSSLTVMFWVKYNFLFSGALIEFSSDIVHPDLSCWLLNSGINYRSTYMAAYNYSMNNANINIFSPVIGIWNHVALVYNGGTSTLAAYTNYSLTGIQQYTMVNVANNWTYVNIAKSLYLGGYWLNGSMYCIKIINEALTSAEITALGQSCMYGKVRFSN